MAYEWDESKNFSNFLKHRIRFEEAVRVFEDPYYIVMKDDHPDEDRFVCVGLSHYIGILVVVYCERGCTYSHYLCQKSKPE
jgi:uncharacterized DUF497 family protein